MLRHTFRTNHRPTPPIFKLLKIPSFAIFPTESNYPFYLVKFVTSFTQNFHQHHLTLQADSPRDQRKKRRHFQKMFNFHEIEIARKKWLHQNFRDWLTVRNFLPYFHRNRFDRQLVDSRRDIPPSWRVNEHWERRRSDTVVGKADAAQFRRYLPIAWRGVRFHFPTISFLDIFSDLGITSASFFHPKKKKNRWNSVLLARNERIIIT